MAIKFQYNKTALQSLEKQLKVRVKALPMPNKNLKQIQHIKIPPQNKAVKKPDSILTLPQVTS